MSNKILINIEKLKKGLIEMDRIEKEWQKEHNRLHNIELKKGNHYYWNKLIEIYPKFKQLTKRHSDSQKGIFENFKIPIFDCTDYGGEYCLDKNGLIKIIKFLEGESE